MLNQENELIAKGHDRKRNADVLYGVTRRELERKVNEQLGLGRGV